VRGGCGYIEEWSDARLLRDAHLGSIWEGTSNIVALDVRRAVGRDGALILGIDRRKSTAVLNAAYDDAAGVTAKFNLNMLTRLNHDVGARFDLDKFQHRAFFNPRASRVEMHLVSKAAQIVKVAGEYIDFEKGESIWTESSYKYDRARLEELIETAGFRLRKLWTNSKRQFWVAYLEAV